MNKPKKPKLKKFPKRPKGKMTPEKAQRYKERVDAVAKERDQKIKQYNKELSAWKAAQKKMKKALEDAKKKMASSKLAA